jgi:TRAP-type C4-dicarboxylate transport system permease small subunit
MIRRLIDHFEEILCALMLAVMSGIMFINVICRYLLRFSLAFTEEVVVGLFVWLTLLGTAAAFREGSHLAFHFFTARVPRSFQKYLMGLQAILGVFLFLSLIYFSLFQIRDEIDLKITSSGIGLPQWWYTAGVPVGCLLVILRILQESWKSIKRIREG